MFGKNYDEDISELYKTNNLLLKKINELQDRILEIMEANSNIQDSLIAIATNSAEHKQYISFLINHASVDEDARDDFFKMLKEVKSISELDTRKKTKKKVQKRE